MTVTDVTRAYEEEARGQEGNDPAVTVAAGRAAQELGVKRGEFELAVHLGLIAMTTAPGGGRPRVGKDEIERLRAQPGFPDALGERVRTVGTAEGAALLAISPARFTRLARAGCFAPVTFYLNRYRAVVWLYLADELAAFATREPALLAGTSPAGMRTMLEAGADWRARNWRSQRIDRLLDRTADAWARAAVQASALDPVQLAEVVDDPYERAYLARVRPEPVFGRPGSVSAREVMGELMLADDPDEILWRRVGLNLELDRAREYRAAPRPGEERVPPMALPDGPPPGQGRHSTPEGAVVLPWRPARDAGPSMPAPRPGPASRPVPARASRPGPDSRPGPAPGFVRPASSEGSFRGRCEGVAEEPSAGSFGASGGDLPRAVSVAAHPPSLRRMPASARGLLARLGWRRRGPDKRWRTAAPHRHAEPHVDQGSNR